MLTQQFRKLMKIITEKPPAPQPVQRRRRGEDTGKAFRMAARKLLRRVHRLPVEAYGHATAYLAETLDWLQLWHAHDDGSMEDMQAPQRDHLYPHL